MRRVVLIKERKFLAFYNSPNLAKQLIGFVETGISEAAIVLF
jgi:hypothetical protein